MYKVDIQNKVLVRLEATGLAVLGLTERYDLQEWIEKSPDILGEQLLVIGKEMTLSSGRRLDLLCVDKAGNLVIVELKRDDSGNAVEWQAIKYASYCSNFLADEIYERCASYLGVSKDAAREKIEAFIDVPMENLNDSQRIILVSREFNSEVLSAVFWLRDFGLNIQCTRLSPYRDSAGQVYLNPETIVPLPEAKDYIEKKEKKTRTSTEQTEWTGCWFVNVGEGEHRSWDDCRRFGFIAAGQGAKWSDALKRLSIGSKIYAYIKQRGYVGFGVVTKESQPIRDFYVESEGKRLLDCDLVAERPNENSDDLERSEWVVGVAWTRSVKRDAAKTFSGVFANQNVTCKLRDEETLKFLGEHFGG